jgi:hypothetical protein
VGDIVHPITGFFGDIMEFIACSLGDLPSGLLSIVRKARVCEAFAPKRSFASGANLKRGRCCRLG